jgi:transcription elongation factor Elf1
MHGDDSFVERAGGPGRVSIGKSIDDDGVAAGSFPTREETSTPGRRRRHPMKKRPRRRRRREAQPEASYVCDSCGEEIVVPVDVSAGCSQDYVEDCPVCCHPMRLQVTIDEDGSARIEGEHE